MKLEELLSEVSYTVLSGDTDMEISDVIYDSRRVCRDCVFVCLAGASFDGHDFAQKAADAGAAAVVVGRDVAVTGAAVIKVDDTRRALAFMSAVYFGAPAKELTTIGITGTKGKTTTACMIRSILESAGMKTGVIGTLGIIIGDKLIKTANTTPESYEIQRAMRRMIDEGCKCVVMEASSLGLKWHRTDGFVFDYGIFTNFSHDHIGGVEHADMEEYAQCKAMLFRQCRTGILRASDDELVSKAGYLGVRFKVSGRLDMTVSAAVPGKFNVYNALAAIAVCLDAGADKKAIEKGLNGFKVKGRVEPVPISADFTLLIDYAHNALSMENILSTLREYKPERLITLFGAGGNRPRDRRFEMGEISGRMSDLSVITEDNSRFENVMDIIEDIKTGINKTGGKYVVVPDRTDAIRYCLENGRKGDIIVLAGKGHEDYQDKNGVKTHYDEREVIAQLIAEGVLDKKA